MRVQSADTDSWSAAEHELHRFGAQLDGSHDALLVESARLLERDVGGDVYGGELLACEQHARVCSAAYLCDVFRVSGEDSPGHCDAFVVERRGYHGVDRAARTPFCRATNVTIGGDAILVRA